MVYHYSGHFLARVSSCVGLLSSLLTNRALFGPKWAPPDFFAMLPPGGGTQSRRKETDAVSGAYVGISAFYFNLFLLS